MSVPAQPLTDAHPIAGLVHLSGARRGTTQRLAGEFLTIGTASEADVVFIDRYEEEATIRAGLVARGTTYELVAEPGFTVWVNGKETEKMLLASDDIIEIGRGAPALRFRIYPPGSPAYKTISEAVSDCVESVRLSDDNLLKQTSMLAVGVPRELATQTSIVFRMAVTVALVGLAISTTLLASRSASLERRLSEELARVAGLSRLIEQSADQTLDVEDIEALRAEIAARLEEASGRIGELEARSVAVARIVAEASNATVFLQGSYAFRDVDSGRRLRVMLNAAGEPIRNAIGHPALTLEGDGPVFEVQYTGTGFVVDSVATGDLIVTNRHVALPWEFDENARGILQRGFEGVPVRLRGFLPGSATEIVVSLSRASESADLALLRASGLPASVGRLTFSDRVPNAGDGIVVLGYPLGIRALVARTDPAFLEGLAGEDAVGFWEVADRLSREGRIAPLATRGIVGQVTPTTIVYDAETTSGGSGGPVLDLEGRVVAINAAILPQFGGSNMGVPASEGVALLELERDDP
jgi:S1-C subfamily serine protease